MSLGYYQESDSSGTTVTWKRAGQIILTNTINGAPTALFVEQIATQTPDGNVYTQPSTQIEFACTDMTQTFNLIDPSSGSVVGTMSYGDLYAALYSAYLGLAAARDAATSG